jgi:hypothetical protein
MYYIIYIPLPAIKVVLDNYIRSNLVNQMYTCAIRY